MKNGKFIFLTMLIAVIAITFTLVFACTTPGEEDDNNDGGTTSSGTVSSGTSSSETSSLASSSSSSDDGKIHIAYVVTGTTTTESIYLSLMANSDFVVTVVSISAADLLTQCNNNHVVLASESLGSRTAGFLSLRGINKPFLMMKTYEYRSDASGGITGWVWATEGYGNDATLATNVQVTNTSHVIFTGVTFVNTNEVQLISTPSATGLSFMAPAFFTSVTGGTIDNIANIKDVAANSCIMEIPVGTTVSGTLIQSKFLQIAIHSASFANITASGFKVISNAIYYLTDNVIPVSSSSASSEASSETSSVASSESSSEVSSVSSSEASSEVSSVASSEASSEVSSVSSSEASSEASSVASVSTTAIPYTENFSAADASTFFSTGYKTISSDITKPLNILTGGSITITSGQCTIFDGARFSIGDADPGIATLAATPHDGDFDLSQPYTITFDVISNSNPTGTTAKFQVFVDNNTTSSGASYHSTIGSTASRILTINSANDVLTVGTHTINSSVGTNNSFIQFRTESAVDAAIVIDNITITYQ